MRLERITRPEGGVSSPLGTEGPLRWPDPFLLLSLAILGAAKTPGE